MADGAMRLSIPPVEATTRLFARGLGWSPEQLRERFRPAAAADLPALLAFRGHTDWDDAAYLRWRYGLEGEAAYSPGDMWILRNDKEVLAAIGREKQPIHYRSQIHDGQLLMDVQLRTDLEGAGGGVWLNQMMFAKAEVTLAVGANAGSIGMVKRLFTPLPSRCYCVLPLDCTAMLRQKGVNRVVAKLGAPMLDAAWALAHARARWGAGGGVQVVEALEVQPAWLEQLHEGMRQETACVLLSARHLAWRVFGNPRARYRLLVAHRAGACVGYAAVRNLAAGAQGQPAGLHVLDWKVAATDADATLSALLQAAIATARAEGCNRIVTTLLDAHALPVMKRFGFLVRQAPMLVAGVHAAAPLPGTGGRGDWQITDLSFDSDGEY